MPSPSFRTKTAVLLLAAALAFPLAASAGPRSPRAPEGSASILLDFVGRAWSFLTGSRDKSGCYIDPSGRCVPVRPEPTIQADSGCHIDPDGRCGS
jgi:hypothetical protein